MSKKTEHLSIEISRTVQDNGSISVDIKTDATDFYKNVVGALEFFCENAPVITNHLLGTSGIDDIDTPESYKKSGFVDAETFHEALGRKKAKIEAVFFHLIRMLSDKKD